MADASRPLTVAQEAQLRTAVANVGGGTVDGCALRHALCADNPRWLHMRHAEPLLERAVKSGMLMRSGVYLNDRFRLDEAWQRPETDARPEPRGAVRLREQRGRQAARVRIDVTPAQMARMFGQLMPSLGTVCAPRDPEVMSAEIGDLIDSLHRRHVEQSQEVD